MEPASPTNEKKGSGSLYLIGFGKLYIGVCVCMREGERERVCVCVCVQGLSVKSALGVTSLLNIPKPRDVHAESLWDASPHDCQKALERTPKNRTIVGIALNH